MNRIYATALVTLTLFFATAVAQKSAPQPTSGLLYEITGKNLKQPSYIFGTFHVVCPDDMLSMDKITSYMTKTEQTVMEIDMDDQSELQAMLGSTTLPTGKSLT